MKVIKRIYYFISLVFMVLLVSKCSSAQELQANIPLEIGEVYYQHWIAGVKGGGSGVNVFINIISNKKNIELDSVYFQGKVAKLEMDNNSLFIGRFKTNANQKNDLIMSSNPKEEYGNKVQLPSEKSPFKITNNQCVISYKEGSKIKYFKIDNMAKKQLQAYPSAPRNKE
ncbi:MAG: hypothetical protein GW839_07670 [Flavobacteriales bacterium]|nr:hypothetical protein [Flavobacteriia bacterium]NCP06106.1 hypothetical protein [Flavobacteriales bacterium]PIV94555.1 MAG: hypothetical protein COW44_03630 [Flavobacteriaceae bacterium CG17_big_fil_post_rev_8_21_14_2_50_33_15]PIY10516.1 MAG: hypothetical protein COZ17_09705 [Flavobacteriaceae bacterium CG_4_10_14_3_um_filter_33_47]PJB16373.1 MAG: hypothetical protein CO117_15285 [Flavobacteriaceae bacterium CG_4_9_14_3_um_filter_33_16]